MAGKNVVGSTNAYIESLLRHGWETFLPELTMEQIATIAGIAAAEFTARATQPLPPSNEENES